MTGTPSRTARVSAARRNLKETEGKFPVRGTRTACEATARWARGRIDPKPNVIRIEPAYMRRIYGRKVARLTLRDQSLCPRASIVARRFDKAAEVSRGHSSPLHRRGNPASYPMSTRHIVGQHHAVRTPITALWSRFAGVLTQIGTDGG